MAKKYELFYTGTGPGQSRSIERAGYVFVRGCSTEVPKTVFDELKDQDGFEVERPRPPSADKED